MAVKSSPRTALRYAVGKTAFVGKRAITFPGYKCSR